MNIEFNAYLCINKLKNMEITFDKPYLSDLYHKGQCTDKKHRFQPPVIKKFIRVIDLMESLNCVEDLFRYNALNYEKLKGDKNELESVRVNDQYRIEFISSQVEHETVITICKIIELSNHYK